MKKIVGISLAVVFGIFCLIAFFTRGSGDSADAGKNSASGPVASGQNQPNLRGSASVNGGQNSMTTTQTLVGLPAEIDALGDAAKRTGGKVNGVIILDARNRHQNNLPPNSDGSSQRARDALHHWESLRSDWERHRRDVQKYSELLGPNTINTNCVREKEIAAAKMMKQAWEDYQAILKEER